MPTQAEKCATFARLHAQDKIFLIPNPWDIGSARLLQGLGFSALATTSAGFAYGIGRTDGEITLGDKLRHCEALAAATSIPINVDFENGFSDNPSDVARNVLRVAETGVAGCSVEDYSRDGHELYAFEHAVERVHAATEAVATLGMPFQLTARAENLLRGVTDIDDTIKRLQAFAKAGAQVLYAPGINSLDQLRLVISEIDKPFNVLAPFFNGASVNDFADAGAKRISVGSALTLACIKPLLDASREMLNEGTFSWTSGMASSNEVGALLG